MYRMYHAVRLWLQRENRVCRSQPEKRQRLFAEVLEDRLAPAANLQTILGLNQIQSAHPTLTGAGYTVALLDSGINYNLPSLGGGIGPGYRVLYGYNFVNNTSNALDDNGHGSFLANMIGSSDANNPGIDTGVQFADLKVLDSQMSGNWTAIDNALKWVVANQAKDNIVAVNMSFGSGDYTSDVFNILESDLATLKNMGVFISVASGNNFAANSSQPGLAYPAVDPDVVSVGGTWTGSFGAQTLAGATDNATAAHLLGSFTQRDSALSILAPGAWISSIGINGTPTIMGGTSMSTAVVTGAAVMLHQAMDLSGQSAQASEQGILQVMQSTGTSVVDNNSSSNVTPTGLTFKELNLAAAANAIARPSAPTLTPIANQALNAGQTISVALSVTQAANPPITLSAQIVNLAAQAYQLKQKYGLTTTSNYYTGLVGQSEKWIGSSSGNWYWILPNGEFRVWAGSASATMQTGDLIATLDASFYADPSKLWNAVSTPLPPISLVVKGTNLWIGSTGSWVGSATIQVTASDGQHTAKQSFTLTISGSPLALATIANQSVSHANPKVTVSLNTTGIGTATIPTYSAQVMASAGPAPPVTVSIQGNQLTLSSAPSFVGTYTVQVKASVGATVLTQSFTVTVIDAGPTLAAIADITQSHGTPVVVTLSATDPDAGVLTYSAQALNPSGQKLPISVSVQGTRLTVQSFQPVVGTFAIQVTVSDGALTTTGVFNVTLTNTAPTLTAIASQRLDAGQTVLNVPLSVTDADNDTLTYQAGIQAGSVAYQVEQKYGFHPYGGSYYVNLLGYNEKWLVDNNNVWYAWLPSGAIYRWSGSTMALTIIPSNLIATLDTAMFTNPSLLLNVQPPSTSGLTVSVQGNVVTIQRDPKVTGTYLVIVSASDPWATTQQAFQITLN